MTIKIFADKECMQPINVIEWHNRVIITFISDEKAVLRNTVLAGTVATAHVYVKNDWFGDFHVTGVSHADKRVKVSIAKKLLHPDDPVKMTVKFKVPENPTEADALKSGQVKIEGYYKIVE
jgi:hypothetical protein